MKFAVVVTATLLWSAGLAWCSPRVRKATSSFSEQVTRLLDSIKMPEQDLAAVSTILHDLELALNTHWPGCRIKPFGSTVTGLALVGSDIDAYVLLPNRSVQAHGAINYEAAKVLGRFPDYVDIRPTFYYVPFLHVPSQTRIDLLFNNVEGGRNSALLGYMLLLDDRIQDLAIVVKYWWVKVQQAAGSKLVPAYGMSVMVIFYLQQIDMLPPVALLQKNAKPFIYERWNSGFNEIDYKPRNNVSLYQLLGGFFEFYNDFDYNKYIISTFAGRPLERELFKDLRSVPKEFKFYRRIVGDYMEESLDVTAAAVVVQDPILHNKNLAVLVDVLEGSPFQTEFRRLALKFREDNESAFLDQILDVQ